MQTGVRSGMRPSVQIAIGRIVSVLKGNAMSEEQYCEDCRNSVSIFGCRLRCKVSPIKRYVNRDVDTCSYKMCDVVRNNQPTCKDFKPKS